MNGTLRSRTARQTPREWEASLRLQVLQDHAVRDISEYRWEHAVSDYLAQMSWSLNKRNTIYTLRRIHPTLSSHRLKDITRKRLADIQKELLSAGLSGASINRITSILIAILNRAVEWEWLDHAPSLASLPEGPPRERFLDRAAVERLLRELPDHLRSLAIIALETGLRRANVTMLRWDWINFDQNIITVPVEHAKGQRQSIILPMSPLVRAVLDHWRGHHPEFVFTYRGRPLTQTATRAFRKALRRVGIEDFHWHDLRHTWASWHIQDGTPEIHLQRLGGWRSQKMVARYSHLNVQHLKRTVEKHTGLSPRVLDLLGELPGKDLTSKA